VPSCRDWAPYSSTRAAGNGHTFTKGIVRDVYLVGVHGAALSAVVPQVTYSGGYPTAPLTDATAAPFDVSARVHLTSPGPFSGTLTVTGSWASGAPVVVDVSGAGGDAAVTVTLPAAARVSLWWPAGLGGQPLYSIAAVYAPAGGGPPASLTVATGFRVGHLVTTNDTEPVDPAARGSGGFTMRLKLNGADVWARGANMIPMEELEARQSAAAYVALLTSAVEARMNMLRVCEGAGGVGGGGDTHTHARAHIHAYIHTYTHIYAHTHTPAHECAHAFTCGAGLGRRRLPSERVLRYR
jgi:beta-mannosidase